MSEVSERQQTQMQLVRQEPGTSLCGQCVVAMVSRSRIEDVRAVMGDGRNYPRDVKNGLNAFGFTMPAHSTMRGILVGPSGVEGVAFSLVPTADGPHRGHWVAWSGKEWFDPLFGVRDSLPEDWLCSFYPVTRMTP